MKMTVTGHRPSKFGNDYEMKGELAQKIKASVEDVMSSQRPSIVYIGMALGIDQMCAHICIEQNIPFVAAIPHKGQEKIWPQKSQDIYFELLQNAQSIMIVDRDIMVDYFQYLACGSTMYLGEKMDARNKWMVDQLNILEDKLLAVWDGTKGGTYNCVKYAQNKKKDIIYINPKTL